MKIAVSRPNIPFAVSFVIIMALIFGIFLTLARNVKADSVEKDSGDHLVTIYDRGVKTTVLTKLSAVGEVLDKAGITIDDSDVVEPSIDEELSTTSYQVNIYRARPVVVEDGTARTRIMTAFQTPEQIAASAEVDLYPEDETEIKQASDILSDGAGDIMTIDRAIALEVDLYGKIITMRTQAATVGDMLVEKDIELSANDRVSVDLSMPITADLKLRIWREGKQTVNQDEEVDFETEQIHDADKPVGYKEVQTAGVKGQKTVTYEIEIQNGQEVARTEIASIVTIQPKKEVIVIGTKPSGNGLTKSKGVNYFVDSSGVSHRETYYDLPMSVVMGFCGGTYSVRADGAKVDQNGYVLVAANLANYPRCSIVETSLGLGKVYDTGGFASTHPHGFDLATDWTNYDGR